MRIFMTGATGFVGQHLLPLLGRHEVLAITRDKRRVSRLPFVRVIEGDLGQPAVWHEELAHFRPQCGLHLAWEGLPDYSLACCRVNLDAGLRLMDALMAVRVERMVVSGSCWEYGAVNGAATERQSPVDCGLFATAKNAMREMLESAARDSGMQYRWARIFFAYGPGQRSQALIPSSHAAFRAGGAPAIRQPAVAQDFIHIGDVAAGLLDLIEADVGSGIYNLGSGRPTSVADIVNRVAAHCHAPKPYESTSYETGLWADAGKMADATGWRARISLADGVAQTLAALDQVSV